MSPFTGDGIGSAKQTPIHHQTTPNPGAKNDAEHHLGALPGAVTGLGQRQTVRIIGQSHRATESLLQILLQQLVVETGGIAILHATGDCRRRARRADAHGRSSSGDLAGRSDQIDDSLQGG
jgi:hypothetical protein